MAFPSLENVDASVIVGRGMDRALRICSFEVESAVRVSGTMNFFPAAMATWYSLTSSS